MKAELFSQYKSSLLMLAETIYKCPEALWEDNSYENAFWRIAYHALFYTDLYLSRGVESFIPWQKHRADYNCLGLIIRDGKPALITEVYTQIELTEYTNQLLHYLETHILINANEQSGFEWLPMNKVELHLYNLRHLQHHVGQLVERLHQAGVKGIRWR